MKLIIWRAVKEVVLSILREIYSLDKKRGVTVLSKK